MPDILPSKTQQVQRHFSNIASRYDLANDILSFGLQRAWKRLAVEMLNLSPGEVVLDVCGGTADMARLAVSYMGGDRNLQSVGRRGNPDGVQRAV